MHLWHSLSDTCKASTSIRESEVTDTRRLQKRNLKALMQRRLQEWRNSFGKLPQAELRSACSPGTRNCWTWSNRCSKCMHAVPYSHPSSLQMALLLNEPRCSVLSKYRLKAAGAETLRDEKTFESCMAACRPRENLAKGKSCSGINAHT